MAHLFRRSEIPLKCSALKAPVAQHFNHNTRLAGGDSVDLPSYINKQKQLYDKQGGANTATRKPHSRRKQTVQHKREETKRKKQKASKKPTNLWSMVIQSFTRQKAVRAAICKVPGQKPMKLNFQPWPGSPHQEPDKHTRDGSSS